MTLRTISYGGGVQSTAMVVLAATRDPDFEAAVGGPIDAALFCNVGDDSEHPAALRWVREVVTPWAAERDFPVHELRKTKKDGTTETLLEEMHRQAGFVLIPAFQPSGAPSRRACTSSYKIRVMDKWLRQNGATKDDPAVSCIGFSTDEMERAKGDRPGGVQRRVYPLLDLGLDRSACQRINRDAFGVEAPSSSCYFCPYHSPQVWAEMRRDEPDLFWKAVGIENRINVDRAAEGGTPVWLTRKLKPLNEAIGEAQDTLPGFEHGGIGEGGCDEGVCFV